MQSNQHPAKTPREVAAIFGCTEEQAAAQIKATAAQMRDGAKKAKASAAGLYRGLPTEGYENRATAFEGAL